MLLFTRSSRIRSANVGSHAIVFKNLRFGPFTVKRNPGFSFLTKTGSAAFLEVSVFNLENTGVVSTIGVTVAKVMPFKTKTH